jgi:AcrR family transcriptional regulator
VLSQTLTSGSVAARPGPSPKQPRKDQLRNRRALLDAARRVFRERGVEASIDQVARASGVAPSTLYRHFATKAGLIEALMDELADGSRQIAADAAKIPDAWDALAYVFVHGCVLGDEDLALFDALARTSEQAEARAARATADAIAGAVGRARAAGALRADIDASQVAGLMRLVHQSRSRDVTGTAVRVILDGLKPQTRRAR